MNITPEEALELKATHSAKRNRRVECQKEIKKLQEEIARLDHDLRVSDWIRVHKGRPYLRPYGHDYENLEDTRRAQITKRAVDEFYNVQLDEQKPYGFHNTHYSHVDFALGITEVKAKRLAIAWVLDGKRPTKEDKYGA